MIRYVDKSAPPSRVASAPESKAPGIAAKTKNAAAAGARIVRAAVRREPIRASAGERDRRLAICRACEFWNEAGNIGLGECRHSRCGCTRFKHGLATETCPAGKW